MNDFEKIQKIYEEGYRGLDYNPGPNAKYTANMSSPGYSYRKGQLPTAYPGAGGYSPYEAGQPGDSPSGTASSGYYLVPTALVVDEEIKEVKILNKDVLKKLEELQKEADEDGMNYALEQLSRLKEHIISLSQ